MKIKNIKYLLYPKSIAIIGASTNLNKFSGRLLKFMLKHGYVGNIYPVNQNPEVEEILGVSCYHRLGEIDAPIDQVIIALPAKLVVEAVEECASMNVKSVVLVSSGFAEVDEKGKRIQDQIAEIARLSNIALCGPNCQGIINLNNNVISSFTNVLELDSLIKGNIGVISQSGALAGSILSLAQQRGIGFSHWISVGNEAVLDVADFVKYLATEPGTQVIAAYVEGIKDMGKWVEACEFAHRKNKPIIVLKAGKSDAGGKAIASHTGSVAGEDFIVDAFLKQYGILRVNDISDMFDSMMLLSTGKDSGMGRIGILTSSGGAGILVADACSDCDIEIAELSVVTKEKLRAMLPEYASATNPVDVTAQFFQMIFTQDPDLFKKCCKILLADEAIDILVIAFTMIVGNRAIKIATDVVEVARKSHKPIAVVWLAGAMAEKGYEILRNNSIPLYSDTVGCVEAIRCFITYNLNVKKREKERAGVPPRVEAGDSMDVIRNAKIIFHQTQSVITEYDGKRILSYYDIPVPNGGLAKNEEESVRVAKNLKYPLVLKIDSPDILHKTEAGGVILNVQNKKEVVDAYHQIIGNAKDCCPDAKVKGVLVEEMIKMDGGIEVIVGIKNDPIFGAAIILGIGGIFVEVFKEVVCKIAPLSRRDAKDMVRKIKGYPILDGVRGRPRLSVEALEEVLLNLSRLSVDFRDTIAEIDINPLIVLKEGKGAIAADVLLIKRGDAS